MYYDASIVTKSKSLLEKCGFRKIKTFKITLVPFPLFLHTINCNQFYGDFCMNEINEQIPSSNLPIEEEYIYCMYCPMMCANSYMLRDQMIPEYNIEDFETEEGYRPGPGGNPGPGHGPGGNPGPGHGPGGNPGPGHGPGGNPGPSHGPGGNPGPSHGPGPGHGPIHGPKIWHGHGGYYGHKYYKDINYLYYLNSRYHLYYPYDPYFDYYHNTY